MQTTFSEMFVICIQMNVCAFVLEGLVQFKFRIRKDYLIQSAQRSDQSPVLEETGWICGWLELGEQICSHFRSEDVRD